MHLVAFAAVVAVALTVAVLYPRLRLVMLVVIVPAAALLAYIIFILAAEPRSHRETVDTSALTLTEVEIRAEQRFVVISGRIATAAGTPRLRDVRLVATLRDCPTEDAPDQDCTVIAEDDAIARVDIPGGQTRTFEATVRFNDTPPPLGVARWDYRVAEASATR